MIRTLTMVLQVQISLFLGYKKVQNKQYPALCSRSAYVYHSSSAICCRLQAFDLLSSAMLFGRSTIFVCLYQQAKPRKRFSRRRLVLKDNMFLVIPCSIVVEVVIIILTSACVPTGTKSLLCSQEKVMANVSLGGVPNGTSPAKPFWRQEVPFFASSQTVKVARKCNRCILQSLESQS